MNILAIGGPANLTELPYNPDRAVFIKFFLDDSEQLQTHAYRAEEIPNPYGAGKKVYISNDLTVNEAVEQLMVDMMTEWVSKPYAEDDEPPF